MRREPADHLVKAGKFQGAETVQDRGDRGRRGLGDAAVFIQGQREEMRYRGGLPRPPNIRQQSDESI
jgi:hypothetical protein